MNRIAAIDGYIRMLANPRDVYRAGTSFLHPLAARRSRPAALAAMILILPLLAAAQSNVQPRIASQIDDNRLMTLSGNVHPLARAQNDQGRVDPI